MRVKTSHFHCAFVGLALAAALPSASAVDVTLDFSGNICGVAGNAPCSNGVEIGQNYGDIAGVLDVSARSVTSATGVTFEAYLKYWDTGYSGLTGVAWGGTNAQNYYSELTFTPAADQQVTLLGMSFGDYLDRNFGSSFSIRDLAGTVLFNSGPFNPGLTASIFNPNVTSSTGLILRWGPDGYDVGIDNIRLSVTSVTTPPVTPIPEPETWALMGAGLAAMGWTARRRKAKTA